MSTEQPAQAQKPDHDHHQDTPDGGAGLCLHCRLMETYGQWVEDFTAAEGEPPDVMLMGGMLGAYIGEMTAMVSQVSGNDLEILKEFAQHVMEGQTTTVPVTVVDESGEPNPETRH